MTFKRIAVIGAGTMGSGIAGQIANAGQKVLLLDLTTQATDYALERLQKSEPAPLHQRGNVDLIETGTIEADFDKLAECDWIVEAVVERLDIKRDLYKRLDAVISDDCIVTSNTSTIPIKLLVAKCLWPSGKGLPSPITLIRCATCAFWSLSAAQTPAPM